MQGEDMGDMENYYQQYPPGLQANMGQNMDGGGGM